ncbi:Major facilitator superfamily domain, general substrate transporter [Pseudocohnilembus persalinus]|uniref:Major facilitator superfamily domain, general substrate transporter n=1 Tax=Pseudocohnilembus persalinus TaxID=266149 RepID=A0A0V0QMU2_PSEPJ|nr:Major facilitator superfamily domain, general substrate transporter [Pseudocohnilembus persalinus]|eukprot:KRX03549.1 Major facilitator superfamily domain, general substrate transporter [Pseudocohnilembus persalinus]
MNNQNEETVLTSNSQDLSMDDEVQGLDIQNKQNEGKGIFWNKILLKKQISKVNFFAQLFHYAMMTFIFVSVEILQPELLSRNFGIEQENAGTQNSNIIMVDVGVKILFAPFFGIMADRFGRQKVLIYGIITVAIAIFFMPFSANLYPQYLLWRCFYAQGAICIAVIPLMADYIQDVSKGKAAALNVVMASGGAVLSADLVTGVLSSDNIDIKYSYMVVAISYLILSLLYAIFLKSGLPIQEEDNSLKIVRNPEQRTCTFMMKVGLEASQNPWILMGYITNLLARNDSILLSLYLIIWTYDKTGQENYDKAYIQGHTLAGIAYMSLFLFTIVYGILMEKISKFYVMFVMLLLTALGGFMMIFADSPYDVYTYIVMVVLGSGMSGLQTASLYLIQKYAYKNYRGYITGLSGIFSVLGILICVLSGYLIDSVSDYKYGVK